VKLIVAVCFVALKSCKICRHSAFAGLRIALSIARRDRSDFIAANVAAGPLEDLLCCFGAQLIDTVEREAKADESFRGLLTGVWRNTIEETVWKRVQAATRREN
jgi:hypothetical protein